MLLLERGKSMDREAMVLYLGQLRDLEIAKAALPEKYAIRKQQFYQTQNDLKSVRYESVPEEIPFQETKSPIIFVIVGIVISIVLIAMSWNAFHNNEGLDFTYYLYMLTIPIIFITIGLSRAGDSNRVKKAKLKRDREIEEITTLNREIENHHNENIKKANNLAWDFHNETEMYRKNRREISSLLKSLYSMNILPSQYRTLPAICYIYDYMSTSQATFEDTLMHEHMENGIQRLESKMDQMLDRLEDILYETRMLRGDVQGLARQNEQIIRQNQQMLSNLQSIQTNTKDAAMYAELGANYGEVNAFFSAANYFNTYAYTRR